MMKARAIAVMAGLTCSCLQGPAMSATLQDAFQRPYEELLTEVADQSPVFASAADVGRALTAPAQPASPQSLKKRIAALRMLLADGQLRPAHARSYVVAQNLVAAGEQLLNQPGSHCAANNPNDYALALADDENFNLFDVIVLPLRVIIWILEKLFDLILYPFQLLFGAIF